MPASEPEVFSQCRADSNKVSLLVIAMKDRAGSEPKHPLFYKLLIRLTNTPLVCCDLNDCFVSSAEINDL